MKLLTVAVPAYNAADTLAACLSSLCAAAGALLGERLEVLIIDDGSTDDTAAIAMDFAAQQPAIFRLIRQENGGHGAAVNTAMEAATGRFFRVLDADDWLLNLDDYLNLLAQADVDTEVILNAYRRCDAQRIMDNGQWTMDNELMTLSMPQFWRFFRRDVMRCTIHGCTFALSLLKTTDFRLPEHISYDDEVFVTLPFAHASKVVVSPLPVYAYRIGRAGQSMETAQRIARVDDLYTVAQAIYGYYQAHLPLDRPRRRYFRRRLRGVFHNYFEVCLRLMPNRQAGRAMAAQFYSRMGQEAQDCKGLLLLCYLRFRIMKNGKRKMEGK